LLFEGQVSKIEGFKTKVFKTTAIEISNRMQPNTQQSSCILFSSEVKQLLTSVLGELTVVRDGKFPLLSQ